MWSERDEFVVPPGERTFGRYLAELWREQPLPKLTLAGVTLVFVAMARNRGVLYTLGFLTIPAISLALGYRRFRKRGWV